jgi:FlaA1/EpsC-like NDP-sugar epimerase
LKASRPLHLFLLQRASLLKRWQKRSIAALSDCGMLLLSVLAAYATRIGVWVLFDAPLLMIALVTAAVFTPVFVFSGVYSAIFRYAGHGSMRTIMRSGAIYGAIVAVMLGSGIFPGVPRTVGVIQPVFFIGLVVTSRLLIRFLMVDVLGRHEYNGDTRIILIYGAGASGQQLASSMRSDPAFTPAGFLDDDKRLHGQRLDGLPIFHSDHVHEVINKEGVTDVLLAMPSISRTRRSEVMHRMAELEVRVQTLPPMKDIVDGRVTVSDLRQLEIDDLLGREPVSPNHLLLGRTILGKTILVTGTGGSIGSELARQIVRNGARRLLLFDQSEFSLYAIERELRAMHADGEHSTELVPLLGSVTDLKRLPEIFDTYRPETVFHAAAYKHVPLVEANPIEAVRNNISGTRTTVEAACAAGVADFILVSTDKAVRPTNVMGATKRVAELILQAYAAKSTDTRLSMVRFGNVLGSSGSVVPLFRAQIAAGGPVTLTHREVTRYFMTIPEAAELVIQAGGMARGGEVFVLDMGQPVKIAELARAMIRLSGLSIRDAVNPEGDIAIEEIGLRPGEKLYEELLIGNENESTLHPRILKAHETYLDWITLEGHLDRLAATRDAQAVVEILSEIVPEFAHAPLGQRSNEAMPNGRIV